MLGVSTHTLYQSSSGSFSELDYSCVFYSGIWRNLLQSLCIGPRSSLKRVLTHPSELSGGWGLPCGSEVEFLIQGTPDALQSRQHCHLQPKPSPTAPLPCIFWCDSQGHARGQLEPAHLRAVETETKLGWRSQFRLKPKCSPCWVGWPSNTGTTHSSEAAGKITIKTPVYIRAAVCPSSVEL